MLISLRRWSAASLLALACCAHLSAAVAQADPVPIADTEAIAVLVIPDLAASLKHIEQIAMGFDPTMEPGAFAKGLTMMIGDPGFANLAKGPVLVVVSTGIPMPNFAMIIPAADPQKYVDAGANFGMIMSKAVDKLAVLSQSADGQALGERYAATYADYKSQAIPASTDLRITSAPDRICSAYGPFLSSMVAMQLAAVPVRGNGQPDAEKIALLEVFTMILLGSDITVDQVDLSLTDSAITFQDTVVAKPGSALAKALVAPLVTENLVASRLPAGPGMFLFKGRYTAAPWFTYAVDVIDRLKKKPEMKTLDLEKVGTYLKNWPLGGYRGDMAFRGTLTDNTMEFATVCGITDQVQIAKAQEYANGLLLEIPFLKSAFESAGATVVFTKNVRTVAGLPVDRQSWKIDATKPDPANLRRGLRPVESVIGKDWLAASGDPKLLDAIATSTGTGTGLVLHAEKIFGTGCDSYFDLRIEELIIAGARQAGLGETIPFINSLSKLPPGEPLTAAVTAAQGVVHLQVRIPLTNYFKATQALQGGEAPAKPPGDKGNVF